MNGNRKCCTRLVLLAVLWCVVFLNKGKLCAQEFRLGTEFSSVDSIPDAGIDDAFATYEPDTGNVDLSVGAGLSLVVLDLPAGLPSPNFSLSRLRSEFSSEFAPAAQISLGEPFEEAGVGFFSIDGFPNTGSFNMGPIFPVDPAITTAAQFADQQPAIMFFFNGQGVPDGVFSRLNVIPSAAVPEPSTACLLTPFGVCGVAIRRRKAVVETGSCGATG